MSNSNAAMITNVRQLPKFVGYREVEEALGVSRRTVERMVRDGDFPRPVQLAPNRVGWQLDTLTTWLDKRAKGLAEKAVANPHELKPELLADAAVDFLTRAVEHELGGPIDPAGLRVTYAPPSPAVAEDELADAEASEAALLQQRFAAYDITRSAIVAAWLFPELREAFAASTPDIRARAAYLDPCKLAELAKQALSDETWAEANAELESRRPERDH